MHNLSIAVFVNFWPNAAFLMLAIITGPGFMIFVTPLQYMPWYKWRITTKIFTAAFR